MTSSIIDKINEEISDGLNEQPYPTSNASPISYTTSSDGLRKRTAHSTLQDEYTKAPLSYYEVEKERQKQIKKDRAKVKSLEEKLQWTHSKKNASPRSERLARELRQAHEALEQLKNQVNHSRLKRLSRSSGLFHTPYPRPMASPLGNKNMNDDSKFENTFSLQHGLGLDFGHSLKERQSHVAPFNNHPESQANYPHSHPQVHQHPIPAVLHRDDDCTGKAGSTLASHKYTPAIFPPVSQLQWAFSASAPSPILPSSVNSTPRITSTPTLRSSSWTDSPIPSSTSTFSSMQNQAQSESHSFTSSTSTQANQPTPTPFASTGENKFEQAQSQTQTQDKHIVVASTIAGGIAGAAALAILILLATLFCRRKKKRQQKQMNDVLDRVAPPLPVRKKQNEKEMEEGVEQLPPQGVIKRESSIVEIKVVPSLDSPQLYPGAAAVDVDIEANQHHSHELERSGVLGHTVRSDASFTWKFPKLSVPPAAARAMQSGHYMKKRLTMPAERGLRTSASEAFPSLSASRINVSSYLSKEIQGNTNSIATTDTSESTISTAFLFASHGSTNASSDRIDPQVDHERKMFVKKNFERAHYGRTHWWNNSLRGFGEGNCQEQHISNRDGMKSSRVMSTPPTLNLSDWFGTPPKQNQKTIQEARNSMVILAHDPVMQSVMQKVLFMSDNVGSIDSHESSCSTLAASFAQKSMIEADRMSTFTTAISEDMRHDWRMANQALNNSVNSFQDLIRSPRRASWAGSTLEPCREDLHEGDPLNENVDSKSINPEMMKEEGSHKDQKDSKKILSRPSADYSAHSIVIHPVECEDEKAQTSADEWANSIANSIPVVPNLRPKSSTTLPAPKIMLTSSEEDGRHERQISITTITSSASSMSSLSQNSFQEMNTLEMFTDLVNEIGQAYEENFQDSSEIDLENRDTIHSRDLNRDSESTLDSLVAYTRGEKTESFIIQSSNDCDSLNEVAFNESFARAAMFENDIEQQIKDQRHYSVSPSENGTVCLIDDDFPTIPSWKSMQTKIETQPVLHSKTSEVSLKDGAFF